MRKYIAVIYWLFCCCLPFAKENQATAGRLFYGNEFDSLYVEGVCLLQTDSLLAAQSRLEACAKLQPKSGAVAYQLSTVYAMQQDTAKSIKQLKNAIKYSPNNYYYYTTLAEMYMESSDYKNAAKTYQTITKKFPKKDAPLYALSRCYYQLGDLPKSIETYTALEKRIGVNAGISLEKAFMLALNGNWAAVSVEFDKLHQKFPLDDDLYFREGVIYESIAPKGKSRAEFCYQTALELNPDNADALRYLCDLYEKTGNQVKMEETLLRLFASKSIEWREKKELLIAVNRYYANKLYYEQAMDAIFKKMIMADPTNEEIWLQYIIFLDEHERTEELYSTAADCIGIIPTCIYCHFGRINLAMRQKNDSLLEQFLRDGLKEMPNSLFLNAMIAEYCYQVGLPWKDHAAKAEWAIEADSSQVARVDAINTLAMIYYHENDYEKATDILTPLINDGTANIYTLNNYAFMLAKLGKDMDKASELSAKTIEKEPLEASFLHTYGYILWKQGKLELAKFYMEQSIQYRKKDFPSLFDDYANILDELGEHDKAKAARKQAKEIREQSNEE